MPEITALLHTNNDALRLGRALETLRPCDEILVVDHGSRDATLHIAREYGARILPLGADTTPSHFLQSANNDWILCLEPRESLTESLEASLFEWKSEPPSQVTGASFSVFLRDETPGGWLSLPSPQTRLVPRNWNQWNGHFPADQASALTLEGELLRFLLP
jgi:glycosyltransferase involved in cell wall biosynthesis